MSIYFFSARDQQITALTGAKAIVLPEELASEVFSRLQRVLKEGGDGQNLAEALSQHFEENSGVVELVEEFDHFRCLSASKIAAFLYVWNFLLRINFAASTARQVGAGKFSSHPVFREVVRYWSQVAIFHEGAFPFVEAHTIVARRRGETPSWLLYGDEIDRAVRELDRLPEELKLDADALARRVGQIVDATYVSRVLGDPHLERQNPAPVSHARLTILVCKLLYPLVVRPGVWPRLLYVLRRYVREIALYLVWRSRGPGDEMASAGVLPGVISEGVLIDPIGFAAGRVALESQEAPYAEPRHQMLSNLLWHCLSRLAVGIALRRRGLGLDVVYRYFDALRRFTMKWSTKGAGASVELRGIDHDILARIEGLVANAMERSPSAQLRAVEAVAIEITNKWAGSKPVVEADGDHPIRFALNCSYIHI